MTGYCKCKDVIAVRGDILEVHFELVGIAPEAVKNLWFSSNGAGIITACPYSKIEKCYYLRLGSECTEGLKPCITNYDLTVEFIDGNKITVVRERLFAILEKRNRITEEET